MDRFERLHRVCREFELLSVYLFGSRSDDGMKRLRGHDVTGGGSDLDVGVFGRSGSISVRRLGALQVRLEEVFAPLLVDLVPLDRVDPLFQFAAVQGERVAAPDTTAGMAEAYFAQMAPHLYAGPIEAAANVQFSVCCPNFLILESIETFDGFFSKLLKKPIQWEEGFVIPSSEPGLGVELNEAVCDANPYTSDAVFPPMAEVPLPIYQP